MSSRRLLRKTFAAAVVTSLFVVACGWDPSRPFDREAPEVREAIAHLDAGDAQSAGQLLEEYLATGQCKEGSIGTPPRVRERANGGFDLGLALFQLGESYGRRFGDEEVDAGGPGDENAKAQRTEQVDCALKLVRAIATDATQPVDLRARARYLEGNLLFMTADYENAVHAYDSSLELAPGMHDSGPIVATDSGRTYTPDLVGRDAAWNRAIALRRIEDKKDAGQDASNDASNDGGNDSGGDSGKNDDDKKPDGGDDNKPDASPPDAGKDSGGKDSGAPDSGQEDPNQKKKPDEKEPPKQDPPPQSRQNQDDKILDQLENASTVQQEAAKKQGRARKVRGMSDK